MQWVVHILVYVVWCVFVSDSRRPFLREQTGARTCTRVAECEMQSCAVCCSHTSRGWMANRAAGLTSVGCVKKSFLLQLCDIGVHTVHTTVIATIIRDIRVCHVHCCVHLCDCCDVQFQTADVGSLHTPHVTQPLYFFEVDHHSHIPLYFRSKMHQSR